MIDLLKVRMLSSALTKTNTPVREKLRLKENPLTVGLASFQPLWTDSLPDESLTWGSLTVPQTR
jgi:hypothetical protein